MARSRRAACPWCCTRCGRCAAPRRISPTAWPSWSAPTPSAPTMPRNNAVGLLHEEMRRARLADHARRRRPQATGGRRPCGRPPRLLGRRAADAARPSAGRAWARRGGGPAARRLGQRDRGRRPLTSPALAEAIRTLSGEEALAFFDAIAPIVHHESIDLSIAWKQSRYDKGGPAGDGADYLNCPLNKAGVRGLRRGPAGGRQDRVQGVGAQHALLQRLPADRGDRRQRTADRFASGR